jgi:hypothetical protein
MPRKLLVINVLLLIIAAGSVVFIARQLTSPTPMPLASRSRAASPPARVDEPPRQATGAYGTVAARNLFSPTRSEAPPTPVAAASPAAKPNLFGVILRDGAPMAYLEDPTTKRVAGYRVGDSVAGGTVQKIGADNVVIARPDGDMDVRLRDPGKPRPAAPPAAAAPGAQPVAGQPSLPGVIPPTASPGAAPGAAPPTAPPPGQVVQPGAPPAVPGRRQLPPNLLRRLPQGPQTDAPRQ